MPRRSQLRARLRRTSRLHDWLELLRVRREGRRDGRQGIPSQNDPTSSVWLRIKQSGDEGVQFIAAAWREVNRGLRGRWHQLEHKAHELRKQIAHRSKLVEKAEKHLDQRENALEKKTSALEEGPVRDRLGPTIYRSALALIFIGEFPLNAVAFRIFGEPDYLTYIMTTALAVAFIVGAHTLGVQLRATKIEWPILVLASLGPLALVIAVAVVREHYLALEAATAHDTGLNVLGPAWGTFVFAIVNLAIFFGATLLSYLHHDHDARELARLKKEVRLAERDLSKKSEACQTVERQLAKVRAEADLLRAWGEEELEKAKDLQAAERNRRQFLMMEYKTWNLRGVGRRC